MSREPGADELRIGRILRERGVGYDTPPPPAASREPDWFDALIDYNAPTPPAPEPEPKAEQPAAPKPKAKAKKRKPKRKRRNPNTPRSAWDNPPRHPRQSLTEAWDQVPYRLKWLGYHASSAYLGWSCGLVDWTTHVTAWIADTGLIGPQAIFWYCTAAGTFLLYRRTRGWWWPVAWLAAVPATSTVTGVLLYGTPSL